LHHRKELDYNKDIYFFTISIHAYLLSHNQLFFRLWMHYFAQLINGSEEKIKSQPPAKKKKKKGICEQCTMGLISVNDE